MNLEILHNIKHKPAYVIVEEALIRNLEIIRKIREETNCEIFLSQKCFSIYQIYPLLKKYISGVTAASLNESILGKEHNMFTMTYSPAYKPEEYNNLLNHSDIVIFNSLNQFERYVETSMGNAQMGIRVNPNFSTQSRAFCNPCSAGSRFGVTSEQFKNAYPHFQHKISGIMFHTLSKQELPDLVRTVEEIEKQFGEYLSDLEWISFGGGEHFTKEGYDLNGLIRLIRNFQKKYNIKVFLEPGEAILYNAGVMVSEVLDIVENNSISTAIMDCSPYAHMPDILYFSTQPDITDTVKRNKHSYNYRIAASTCLSGDIIGDYSFKSPLHIGDTLIINNQLSYTMVCNNWFNGLALPEIGILHTNGKYEVIKSFSYEDYKRNL